MNFEISGTAIRYGVIGIVLLTIVIIYLIRSFFNKVAASDLTLKNKGRKWKSPLEARTKYPEVDTFRLSGTFLNYGLLVAIGLMIFAFSWTTYERNIDVSQYLSTLSDEIEMETPRTAEPPPPPPPPPPPSAIVLVASDLPDVKSLTFKGDINDDLPPMEPNKADTKTPAPPPPPPPPPPVEHNEKEIFKIVEENPTFPGCEDISDKEKRKLCSDEKMLQFIYKNIQYPSIARENGVSGMVVVKFVVEIDGSISNIEVVRDMGAGLGEEALRIVKLMPKWNPGRQRGRAVRVQFTLPVKFKLE